MSAMFILVSLFLLSSLLAPWWVVTVVALPLLAMTSAYAPVIAGGIVLDALYAPESGFPLLYTSVFSLLALSAFLLKKHLLE